MKFVIIVSVLLAIAFVTGLSLVLFYPPNKTVTSPPVTQQFTPEGASNVPSGTVTAAIIGSIGITGTIPVGSTINVEVKQAGTEQFSTAVQNIPALANQTFSYTKATKGMNYDMKVALLDTAGKVLGESQIQTVPAPSLNVQFQISSSVPTITPTLTPTPVQTTISPTGRITTTLTPTPTPRPVTPTPTITPTPSLGSLSGNISFHGAAPISSRIIVLEKLANAATYQVAVDNVTPIDGTLWEWKNAISGNSYNVIAVLKQKDSSGNDTDITSSSPVTVTAPSGFIVLTVNSYYSLTKPTGTSGVNCTTYNGGPNQNYWNVTVNFPSFSGAQSYWLEVGSTDGGNDIVNTYGNSLSASAIFNNNTTYYARNAYAAVSGVDTGSGQFSVFSDSTKLSCNK